MNVLFYTNPGDNSRSTLLDMRRGFEQAGHRTFVWESGPMLEGQRQAEQAANARVISPVSGQDGAHGRLAGESVQLLLSAFTRTFEMMLVSNRIDLCVGMWGNALMGFVIEDGPLGARSVFDRTGVPLLCYWLDAPMWAHAGAMPRLLRSGSEGRGGSVFRSPKVVHAINNPGTAMEMSRVFGLCNVIPTPYGIDMEAFAPDLSAPADLREKEYDLVFSYGPGDPPPTELMLDELQAEVPNVRRIRETAAEGIRSELAILVDHWPGGGGRDLARQLLELLLVLQLERRDTQMLARVDGIASARPALRGAVEHLLCDVELWTSVSMCLRRVEGWERAFTYSYLSRHLRCASFGLGDPSVWRCKGVHVGRVDWDRQGAMYSRGRMGLNVMRWQDDMGLNVKPLEITASGTALLCAYRSGLGELFEPGAEALVFRNPADARAQALAALADPTRLKQIALAGQARTRGSHTWFHVARRLSSIVQGHEPEDQADEFAGGPASAMVGGMIRATPVVVVTPGARASIEGGAGRGGQWPR